MSSPLSESDGGVPVRAGALGGFLRPEGYAGPHGLRALSREASTVIELARLVRSSRRYRRSRGARGESPYEVGSQQAVEPVVLVPGFMAGDATLRLLAVHLRGQGFRTYRSRIHVNIGCTREAVDRLEHRVAAVAARRGRRVHIVGHSLGGMLARGLAARRPDLIAGIVTLGSPVLAPAAVHTMLVRNVAVLNRLTAVGVGGLMSADCTSGECARRSFEECRASVAEDLPFTAIYSRRDGIVDWRACLDPAARHVEVHSSHCGMAVDPTVMAAVVGALRGAELSPANPLAARRGSAAATRSACR